MKIGYVLKRFPRLSETFVLNELLELERQGVEVTVFSLYRPDEDVVHPGVAELRGEVVYMPDSKSDSFTQRVKSNLSLLREGRDGIFQGFEELLVDDCPKLWQWMRWGIVLAGEVHTRGVERLHAHFATVASHVSRIAHLAGGVPYSFTCHAKDIYRNSVSPEVFRRLLRDAEFAVTVCDANKQHLDDNVAGDLAQKTETIYNGVDLEHFSVTSNVSAKHERQDAGPLLLGVGRLVEKKGFHHLIRACSSLEAAGERFRCIVVGEGEERPRLEALIDDLGLSTVSLAGALPQDRVRELLRGATVMALPCTVTSDGNRDALPTVLLEALATGVPVVSTPVAGVAEILGGGDSGVLVPIDDADALARAVGGLLADPQRRRQLAVRGRRRAEELFDLRKNVGRLRGLFSQHSGRAVQGAYR